MRVQTFSRAQILEDFKLRFQSLAANDYRGFKHEFEYLELVGQNIPSRVGAADVNQSKNRYPYIVPYDYCRVRLSVQNQNPFSDYINASYVPGGGTERDFICAQGPLPHTAADFWRMVWEQNVQIIVMVTALRHKDIVLCEKYWPLEPGTVQHGHIQVTTVTRQHGSDYFITKINLRQRDCPTDRTITHYYYPSWPDFGIPKDPGSLCTFTEQVRQHLETLPRLGPAVVHCSAGVGRSGTFVALLWLMQLSARGVRPDVKAAVEDLRLHRMWMVQKLAPNTRSPEPSLVPATQLRFKIDKGQKDAPSSQKVNIRSGAVCSTTLFAPLQPSQEAPAVAVAKARVNDVSSSTPSDIQVKKKGIS